MQIEHELKVIPFDHLKEELDRLGKEGWQLMPGVAPVALYHLVRTQQPQAFAAVGGFGKLMVDESKVQIIRDGKVVE